MNSTEKTVIQKTATALDANKQQEELFAQQQTYTLPNRTAIIEIINSLREVVFPGYFSQTGAEEYASDYYTGNSISLLFKKLHEQILAALLYKNDAIKNEAEQKAEEICVRFFRKLPCIQSLLHKEVQAGFDGDPAAKSKEEIIFSYPGFFATYVYRIAHELYQQEVPFIPRIMTEYAHSMTGIDINAGAVIGEYFFIDHGTGVVIGETTVIGNNVKVYQGVTLGALSTRSGQQLSGKKRHPTIENDVTIYSGATILGGETVIGEGSVVGGNVFITESIPPHTKVSIKKPELTLRGPAIKGMEDIEYII